MDDLKVGDYITAFTDTHVALYSGIVFGVQQNSATIKRDDGVIGGGQQILDYPQKGCINCGYAINKKPNGSWNNGMSGYILINQPNQGKKENDVMGLKEEFMAQNTAEPKKSFREAGITDNFDMLTNDGKELFLSWLLHNRHADDFKAEVVNPILEKRRL